MTTDSATRPVADTDTAPVITCRLCGSTDLRSFLDLGATPPCELFLTAAAVEAPEPTYPLHVRVCERCLLAQIPPLITPEETFTEYAYFSSFSTSWVEHARRFVDGAVDRAGPRPRTPSWSRWPATTATCCSTSSSAASAAWASSRRSTWARPRGRRACPRSPRSSPRRPAAQVREQHGPADLVCLNNVYAHIPDVVGFTEGLRAMVADDGWVSIEVQHLLTLVEHTQFDTVYHEHFQYYTVLTGQRALASGGLTLVDVELAAHPRRLDPACGRGPAEIAGEPSQAVRDVLAAEKGAGLHTAEGHDGFAEAVSRVRDDLVAFLIEARRAGKKVVGYGAPGKGNTLLNYCGIRPDLLAYTVDRNPYKHGRFTPGTRIPILAPERIAEDKPDYVLILPWNLRDELIAQLSYVREWGGSLVFPIPHLEVVS